MKILNGRASTTPLLELVSDNNAEVSDISRRPMLPMSGIARAKGLVRVVDGVRVTGQYVRNSCTSQISCSVTFHEVPRTSSNFIKKA
jgi:hypothetical protein